MNKLKVALSELYKIEERLTSLVCGLEDELEAVREQTNTLLIAIREMEERGE